MDGQGPKHQQLCRTLRDMLNAGRWQVGDKLPSDNELMCEFGLSRSTVRQAVDALVNEGRIERLRGSGTYVCDHKLFESISESVIGLLVFPGGFVPDGRRSGFYGDLLAELLLALGACGARPVNLPPGNASASPVDGLLVIGDAAVPRAAEIPRHLPTVFVDVDPFPGAPTGIHVVSRNVEGAREAVQHLIGLGRRMIGFVGEAHPNYQLRHAGYCQALALSGLPLDPTHTWMNPRQAVADLILEPGRVDALFCASDAMGVNIMTSLLGAGIPVPDRIAIAAFDGTTVATMVEPGLTSIHVDRPAMAQQAVRSLNDVLRQSPLSVQRIEVPCTLMVRGSSQTQGQPQ